MTIGLFTALVAILYTVEAVEAWDQYGGIKQAVSTFRDPTSHTCQKKYEALAQARKRMVVCAGFAFSYWGMACLKLVQILKYENVAYASL